MKPTRGNASALPTRRSFASCLAAAAAPAGLRAPRRLRVLCYNIHHAEGMDRRIDLPRIAGVVNAARPDVAMLQEVDRRTERAGGVDQLAELSRLTGLGMFFGKTIPFRGGDYGNAILTRLRVEEHTNLALPGAEPRGAVAIRAEGGLLFLSTHFDVGRDPAARVASAERINRWIAARGPALAILAGDFNDVRGSAPLATLAREWTVAGREIPTIPVASPARQIDFILFRPANRWRVVEVKVLDEPVASDHLPLFAELELAPRP